MAKFANLVMFFTSYNETFQFTVLTKMAACAFYQNCFFIIENFLQNFVCCFVAISRDENFAICGPFRLEYIVCHPSRRVRRQSVRHYWRTIALHHQSCQVLSTWRSQQE